MEDRDYYAEVRDILEDWVEEIGKIKVESELGVILDDIEIED